MARSNSQQICEAPLRGRSAAIFGGGGQGARRCGNDAAIQLSPEVQRRSNKAAEQTNKRNKQTQQTNATNKQAQRVAILLGAIGTL